MGRSGAEPTPLPVFSEFTLNPAIIRTHQRIAMVRSGNMKLVANMDSPGEGLLLYDLSTDPLELRNLADEGGYADAQASLIGVLESHFEP